MKKRFHCRNTGVVSQALVDVTGSAAKRPQLAAPAPESVRENVRIFVGHGFSRAVKKAESVRL